jgi:COMPASS component SPP1
MLQLVELATKRREAAIAATASLGKGQALGKDFCGYDWRLDAVGATSSFAAFVRSQAGETIFQTGRLEAPTADMAVDMEDGDSKAENGTKTKESITDLTAGMCSKKKCKPHLYWSGALIKAIKQQIKELTAQAKEKLDAEARVRDGAAVRYRRRLRENNWVTVVESDEDMEDN